MKLQKVLLIVGVAILLYYVCRQVHTKHKYVESLEEDRILSQADMRELSDYYRDLGMGKSVDPSTLSNKVKVFLNTVAEHPFTALTDSALKNLKDPMWDKPVKREEFVETMMRRILQLLADYQKTYIEEKNTPSKDEFIARLSELIKKDQDFFVGLEAIQFAISDDYPYPNDGSDPQRLEESKKFLKSMFSKNRDGIIQLFGHIVKINIDGSKNVNLSGPLQTNAIDLTYAYLYPNQDIFSWLASLFFG